MLDGTIAIGAVAYKGFGSTITYTSALAVPDEISTGATVWRAKKPSASSSTKTTPATGAW